MPAFPRERASETECRFCVRNCQTSREDIGVKYTGFRRIPCQVNKNLDDTLVELIKQSSCTVVPEGDVER